ncbi:hypothetical protein QQS21_009348 [Conoideocrella luteorostrata]|uniref:Defect at low temperature protein 1 n=1 Tax=Conoideocrella luteorostrata TaxID=1105319 RepID=A0AAJ0CLG8_9HYPO|nr:hypothetical protein QQS21_009348 [Conoideocrella luteorostrata]
MQYRRLFFRILYGSVYVLFFLVLLGLLLVTPGDAIERSLSNGQNYNVLIVTISYVVTVMTVVFMYILRLYIMKTALAAIPKTWVPIDKGDVKDAVYRMIHIGLSRSAMIAYEARPRDQFANLNDGHRGSETGNQRAKPGLRKSRTAVEDLGLPLPPSRPVWGEIEHYGWASPNSSDLRNVEYSSVLSELPNLTEAKALTLAPVEVEDQAGSGLDGNAVVDPEATDLLQRMSNMTMREYFDHLSSLGVIPMDETTTLFLSQYEYARFSNKPISNQRFRELMHLFADILRAMQPLDFNILNSLEDGSYDWGPSESDIDNDAPLYTNPPSPQSSISRPATTSSKNSAQRLPPMRTSSAQAWSFRTAPNTPGSRRTGVLSRKSSENSFARTRRQYTVSSHPSSSSLRSKATGSSDSGSVIRLSTREDTDTLPYVLNLRPTAGS